MQVDNTKSVSKKDEATPITILDGCDHYKPKPGSLLVVKMCAFCQFGQFEAQNRYGLCQYPRGAKEEKE